MEYTDLFSRSIGDFTDIVQKEMFTFQDRKDRSITLRPEGTAGIIRAYIDNNFSYNAGVTKLYSYGPMFRAERPQKGRLREFHQFGCEAVGSNNPLLDAEIIEIHVRLLEKLKLKDFILELNSVGCRICRKDYTVILKEFLIKIKEQLCENCRLRVEHNPLRIFDCKNEECQKLYIDSPFLTDFLCKDCREHLDVVQAYLKLKNIEFRINKKLVRGFDYYTKTVFEVKSGSIGAQNALLGGGRYDYLVELLGGRPTPAVGAAVGMERLLMALNEQNVRPSMDPGKKNRIYIACAGKPDELIKFKVIGLLRDNDYVCLYAYDEKSLKAQLKEADKLNSNFCLILGEEELKNNALILRSLEKSTQNNIALDDFYKNFTNYLK